MAILRYDPTRTTTLRRQYMAEMRRRFYKVRKLVNDAIGKLDALGLRENEPLNLQQQLLSNQLPARQAWRFQTDSQKLASFQGWLQEQIDAEVLSVDAAGKPWTAKYVDSAYRKGVIRSYGEAHKEAMAESPEFYRGKRQQFLESSFAQGERLSKLQFLATRSFEELRGITSVMAQQMNRILADGLAQGLGPATIARNLSKNITGITRQRALVLARTEIIAAHAEGQLDGFEELQVEKVQVMAEWSTAGDDLVCELCLPLEGAIMTVREARGMIPRHPNCRCAWMPANVGERAKSQLEKDLAATPAKIRSSLKAGLPKKTRAGVKVPQTVREAKRRSTWAGKGTRVAKAVPPSPVPAPLPAVPRTPKLDQTYRRGKREFRHADLTKTDKKAILEYQSGSYDSDVGGFTSIQGYLREGEVPAWLKKHGVTRAKVGKYVDEIDAALKKSVAAEEMVAYRGIRDSATTFGIDDIRDLRPGLRFTDKGYTSTTMSRKVASDRFAQKLNRWEDPRVLNITIPEGHPAMPMQMVSDIAGVEREIVLPRGLTFEIERISGKNIYLKIV